MNNLVVKRSQLVEAQIKGAPAIGKHYQFTDVPNISRNNIVIYGFEVYSQTQLVTSPNNNTVIAAADIPRICLTLVDNDNNERIYQIPYYSCVRNLNGGFTFMVKPFILNLTRSYIQITATAGGSLADGQVALVNLYYAIVGEN